MTATEWGATSTPTSPASPSLEYDPGVRTSHTQFDAGIIPYGEVRVTDPDTGAQKGTKPERHDLIPTGALATLARVYGMGAAKYDDHNWRMGYDWSLSYAALQRHATAFWGGEDLDPESGLPHMAHVAWHAFALTTFMTEHPEKDNRYGNR